MNNWARFFFGTPARFITTLCVLMVLAYVVRPEVGRVLLERAALGTNYAVFKIAVPILVMFLGYQVVRRGFGGKKGGGGK